MCVGLVGLGGGEIDTPALRSRCGMHLRVAISTSTCIMIGTGLVAVATRGSCCSQTVIPTIDTAEYGGCKLRTRFEHVPEAPFDTVIEPGGQIAAQ